MIYYIILIINLYVTTKSEPIGVSDTTAGTTADITKAHSHIRNISNNVLTTSKPKDINVTDPQTRRILDGHLVGDTRPYMVYLRAAVVKGAPHTELDEDNWLCGGVIIHERYVLTSAACIENALHFYVVSGTHKWNKGSAKDVDCINNGAKKAVWKCVPKSYVYDGNEFDNIRWMVNDIAVVKVEDEFNFEKRIKGCDFVPQKVAYNNVSIDHEKPNSMASIAGWGSTEYFTDATSDLLITVALPLGASNPKDLWDTATVPIILGDKFDNTHLAKLEGESVSLTESPSEDTNNPGRALPEVDKDKLRQGYPGLQYERPPANSPDLLETEVIVISKKACKKRWPDRYHYIIDSYVICGKDGTDTDSMSKACADHEVNCKELIYSQESEENDRRSGKYYRSRKAIAKSGKKSGGFCENDHGGPLISGYGKTALVIGVISACLTTEITNKCHGPFLYTSVYNNRHLISCAIDKDMGATCRSLLRTSQTQMQETNFVWTNHPHGPAKSEPEEEVDDDDSARKQVETNPLSIEGGVPFRSMHPRPDPDNPIYVTENADTPTQSPDHELINTNVSLEITTLTTTVTTTELETTTDEFNPPPFPDDET